ncbi:MAG: signal peptidase I [Deltaproteobacteria bacterium]|nr:signal peptidase I [Deltaproteobacteria bacterium]MBN2672781.1 signal peptidase I [Deltaproteobacteria bacterium]
MKTLVKLVISVLVIIAVIAIVGRLFFFDIGKTENYSMIPNIIPGDIFLFRTVGLLGKGDIAVCRNPEDPSTLVVGRIIGVPGEKITLKGNHFLYDQRMVHHNYTEPLIYFDTSTEEHMKYVVRAAEEKTGGVLYTVAFMDTSRGRNFHETIVPEHKFFLVGDNRNMAYDSRNFGFVPIDSCLGEAFFILWAAETNGDLKQSERSFSWIK